MKFLLSISNIIVNINLFHTFHMKNPKTSFACLKSEFIQILVSEKKHWDLNFNIIHNFLSEFLV